MGSGSACMERTGTSRSYPSGPARQVARRYVVGQPDAVGRTAYGAVVVVGWRSGWRSDDSPSLKGRGFYGFAPRLCRPTAIRLASFNTREVECAAPAYRTSTTSKTRSCFYPRERLTVERPNTIQLARCYQAVSHISSDARLRARRHASPALKRRGLLPLKGKGYSSQQLTQSGLTIISVRPLFSWFLTGRRERDSNPRSFRTAVFKTAAIDHSAIPPDA